MSSSTLLAQFEAAWLDWSYPVTIREPSHVEPTGDPLVDNWCHLKGWVSQHAEPVAVEGDTLTIRAERGWTREVRAQAQSSLRWWAEATGLPLERVVTENGRVTPPAPPPPPTERTERNTLPLDANWRESVARFLSSGLTIADLKRLIGVAMRKPGLPTGDVFRYFCGCAWREITDLQESARRIIESEEGHGQD